VSDNSAVPPDPTVATADQEWPSDPLITLEQDRSVLAWLHGSNQLSPATTGYLCEALLEWALLGLTWPEEAEPDAGPDCDHLQALAQIAERLQQRIVLAQPLSAKFDLGRVGRLLNRAIRCELDPVALQDSLDRELVHAMPWLAGPPAPVVLADDRVL
jgi:hypothetical protein